MAHRVEYCVLCHSGAVAIAGKGARMMTSTCFACGGVVLLEFAPPGSPNEHTTVEVIVRPVHQRSRYN